MKNDSSSAVSHSRLVIGVILVAAALFAMVIFLLKSSYSIASSLYNGQTSVEQSTTQQDQDTLPTSQ